jgi:hypothetical protein
MNPTTQATDPIISFYLLRNKIPFLLQNLTRNFIFARALLLIVAFYMMPPRSQISMCTSRLTKGPPIFIHDNTCLLVTMFQPDPKPDGSGPPVQNHVGSMW